MLERELDHNPDASTDSLDGDPEEGAGETFCTPVCVALVVTALIIAVVGRALGLSGAAQVVALGLSGAAAACLIALVVLLAGLPRRGATGGAAEFRRHQQMDRVYGVLVAAVAMTAVAAFVVLSAAPVGVPN